MPYLQVFIQGRRQRWEQRRDPSPNFAESQARKDLDELREQFPLQQSGGIFYRMNHDSVLFEQPEHMALTLEQEVWLERHGYDPRVDVNFYHDRTQGCRVCGLPFDEVPEGYIGGFRCLHAGNPYRITRVGISCSSEEFSYIQRISRHRYGMIEAVYLREMALTLVDLIEPAQERSLSASDSFSSFVADFIATNTCFECQQPLTKCLCPKEVFPLEAAFTHEEYARLQTMAQHDGLTPSTFIRRALGIPAVYCAFQSRSAARGHMLSCDLSFFLSSLAQPNQLSLQRSNKRMFSIGPSGSPIPFDTYQLTLQATQLADAFPSLSDRVITILTGLPTTPLSSSHLSWCKTQLEQLAPATYQQARPCTTQDITELERICHLTLPPAYREFLRWMGYGAGSFLQYLYCFFPGLSAHQQAARTLLMQDASPATLPDDAFVIHFQPGDHFTFFRTSEGDDPPVYAHKRDWRVKPFQKIFYRFSDFLAIQLALYTTYQQPGRLYAPMRGENFRDRFLAMQERVRSIIKPQQAQQ